MITPLATPQADWPNGPEVSVVMPAYNAADTIEASISSVLAQSYRSVELLVIDDHSRDGTWEVAQKAASQDARVVSLRQARNEGVAAARNLGLEAARGRILAFLDSDDTWCQDKLALQVAHMRATSSLVSYGAYRRVDSVGRFLSCVQPPKRVAYSDMLKSNRIGNLTGAFDRTLGEVRFKRVGHEDYVFWLELVRRAGEATRFAQGEPVADYLVRDGSLSGNKLRAAGWQWRIYREIEQLGPVRSGWYFAHYAKNALLKRHRRSPVSAR